RSSIAVATAAMMHDRPRQRGRSIHLIGRQNLVDRTRGSPYSYGDAAIASCDIAIARVRRAEFDGALEILCPVLELPTSQRIHPIVTSLHTVDSSLQAVHDSSAAPRITLAMRQEITTFTNAPTAPQ
ncbi:hypothetical protein ACWCW7_34935, partial [Nocardia tengchongensis]